MSRWQWGLVALPAAVVAAVLVVAWPGGPEGGESHAGVPVTAYAYIDKNIHNGDGPCDPDYIDDATVETVGSTHKLAVCIDSLPVPVGAFELGIRYDDLLDECEDEDCADDLCLDDNPDANAGATTWGDGLGQGWDCDIEGQPICDGDGDTGPQEGLALIWCEALDGVPAALGDGESQRVVADGDNWATLAVLTLDVAAAGTDEVIIDYLAVWGPPGTGLIGACGGVDGVDGVFTQTVVQDGMACYGAKDRKRPPSEKPTPTPTEVPPTSTSVPPTSTPPPVPTATPFGGPGGIVVAPPPTGAGPSGGGMPWTLMASLLAGGAGAAIAAGGVARFAKGRRR
jgi:hypothetical protein